MTAVNPQALDDCLKQMVDALGRTVAWGIAHLGDPKAAKKAIRDCQEILDLVLEGDVSAWLRS